jgi:hypothetical protein
MAQRKSGPTAPTKAGANRGAGVRTPPGRPPARKKPGKSIVNQRQTPWGLIATVVAIVVFAAAIVVAVVATRKHTSVAGCSQMIGKNPTTYLNELTCASKIKGVTFKPEADRNHVAGTIQYDSTPPVGGNHSPYWADCNGTVYASAIANENAVHMLEHGAIWIAYQPNLPATDVAQLEKYVINQDRMAMSPYPNLDTPISLQAWGYQLKVSSPTDPRIQKFIDALRYNPKTTPEYGATCSDPTFKAHPSTFGHPLEQPAA